MSNFEKAGRLIDYLLGQLAESNLETDDSDSKS